MLKKSFFKNRRFNLNEQIRHWKHNWRNGLFRLVERIFSGKNVSDLLGGNLIQISHLVDVQTQVTSIRLIEPGETLNFQTRVGLSGDSFLNVEEVIQPQYEIILSALKADVRSGILQLESGFIIDSTLAQWQRLMYRGGMSHSVASLKKSATQIAGAWTILPYSDYYFHTLIEDLPQIIRAFQRNSNLTILTTPDNPKWTFELLDFFDIPYKTTKSRNVRIEKYVAITAPRGISPQTVNLLRDNSKIFASAPNRRILLSRGYLTNRADPALEEKLADSLVSYGFELINPSQFSVLDQIKLFSDAEVIIGLHGGGLSNAVWAPIGCKVIELFNHPYRTLDFARLSSAAGHKYKSLEVLENGTTEVNFQALRKSIETLITS